MTLEFMKAQTQIKKLRRLRCIRGLGHGTTAKQIGPVVLCSMKPEYRDCLDQAMAEWKKHITKLRGNVPKQFANRHSRSIYAFAYWLIRWSELVKPAKWPNTKLRSVPPERSKI